MIADTYECDSCLGESAPPGGTDGGPYETPSGDYICMSCRNDQIARAESIIHSGDQETEAPHA